jgi:hypothetical protein
MQSQHKGRLLALFPALLSTLAATPALAESNWWIAEETGSKPNRVMVLVDLGDVRSDELRAEGTGPFIEVKLNVIYESASQPDFSSMRVRNFCDRQTSDVYIPFTYWRDNRSDNTLAGIAHMPSKATLANLLTLTCVDAKKGMMAGQFKPISGPASTNPYPTDYPWKSAWLDGSRPAYTKTGTIAVQPTDNLTAEQRQAAYEKLRDATVNKAQGTIAQINRDKAFQQASAQHLANRKATKYDRYLLGWIGQSEDQLIQKWGSPNQTGQTSLTYQLTLDWEFKNEYGQVEDEDSTRCDITFEIFEGKVFDFGFRGQQCEKALKKQPAALD